MSAARIRRAVPADAAELARMRYEFREELDGAAEAEEPFVERCAAWMGPRLSADSAWRCFVAEREGAIVGHVWVQLFEKIPNPCEGEPEFHAYITNCYVRASERGSGLGRSLLEAALTDSRDAGAHAAILWPSARSRPLYARLGFTVREDVLGMDLSDWEAP